MPSCSKPQSRDWLLFPPCCLYLKYNHSSIPKLFKGSCLSGQITAPAIKRKNFRSCSFRSDTDKFIFGKQNYQGILAANISLSCQVMCRPLILIIDLFTLIDTAEIILQQAHHIYFVTVMDF